MRVKYIAFVCLFLAFTMCIAYGEGTPGESTNDSDYLVVLLKPTDSDINLHSILSEIELEFKLNGIKFIAREEGHLAEGYEIPLTGSIADSITALRIQLLKLETHLNELETSIIESEGSKEESAYSIESINNQIQELKGDLEEIGTRTLFNDRDFSALERSCSELNELISHQKIQIAELQKEKDELLRYVNKSVSGSQRFIALLFIILLMVVSIMAIGTLKERFFAHRDQWP